MLSPRPRQLGLAARRAPSRLTGQRPGSLSFTDSPPACLSGSRSALCDSLPTLPRAPSRGLSGGLCPVLLHSSAPGVFPWASWGPGSEQGGLCLRGDGILLADGGWVG